MENPSDPISSPRAQGQSTTFIHTDANSFKELVQRLTGPRDESSAQTSSSPSSAPPRTSGLRRPTFKLQERRQGSRSKLAIMRPNPYLVPLMGFSSSSPSGLVSPSSPGSYLFSPLICPSAYLSGLKLSNAKSTKVSNLGLDEEAEEKAIKEGRFYLHPSPRGSRPMSSETELLQLFPLSSHSPKPVGPRTGCFCFGKSCLPVHAFCPASSLTCGSTCQRLAEKMTGQNALDK